MTKGEQTVLGYIREDVQEMKGDLKELDKKVTTNTTTLTDFRKHCADVQAAKLANHPATFRAGPLAGVPVKYAFYLTALVVVMGAGVLMFAMTHGKLNDLAEAVNTVRGQANVREMPDSAIAVK